MKNKKKLITLLLLLNLFFPLQFTYSQEVELGRKISDQNFNFTVNIPREELWWNYFEDRNQTTVSSKLFQDFKIIIKSSTIESPEKSPKEISEDLINKYMESKKAHFAGKEVILQQENKGFATAIIYNKDEIDFFEWIEIWVNTEKGMEVTLIVSGRDPQQRTGIMNYATAIEETFQWYKEYKVFNSSQNCQNVDKVFHFNNNFTDKNEIKLGEESFHSTQTPFYFKKLAKEYVNLREGQLSLKKGEFETTGEYEKRIEEYKKEIEKRINQTYSCEYLYSDSCFKKEENYEKEKHRTFNLANLCNYGFAFSLGNYDIGKGAFPLNLSKIDNIYSNPFIFNNLPYLIPVNIDDAKEIRKLSESLYDSSSLKLTFTFKITSVSKYNPSEVTSYYEPLIKAEICYLTLSWKEKLFWSYPPNSTLKQVESMLLGFNDFCNL